jgi:hypothetical protein
LSRSATSALSQVLQLWADPTTGKALPPRGNTAIIDAEKPIAALLRRRRRFRLCPFTRRFLCTQDCVHSLPTPVASGSPCQRAQCEMSGWHGLRNGHFQPRPLVDDLPVLGSGPLGGSHRPGGRFFLATGAKVNERTATRLRHGGALGRYREPSDHAHSVLMSQPFTPVIMPRPRDAWRRTQRGVQ